MKLSTKILTGLATAASIATPLVTLTGCSSTQDSYVVDVTNGYTPSDVHKLDSTDVTTQSKAMELWFNHAALNRMTPAEEFRWTMGEMAKKIRDYNTEVDGIKVYTQVRSVTAGMKGFEVNDLITRKVSYETKGSFHFDFFIDFTNAEDLPEGFQKLLYKAAIDIDYHIMMKNISIVYGDETALASMIPYGLLMSIGSFGIDISKLTAQMLPSLAGNEAALNVFPDLLSLSSGDHTWMFGVNFDGKMKLSSGDYEYGTYGLSFDRIVDYETSLFIEQIGKIPAEYLEMLNIVGMFSIWKSYYVSSLTYPNYAERVASEDEDISKPINFTKSDIESEMVQGTINVLLNDSDPSEVESIGSITPLLSVGYSKNFDIKYGGLVNAEEKPHLYKYGFTVSQKVDKDGEKIPLPAGIINETIYLPIINIGKWFASIPVNITVQ